jgi:asparagine synthase (glutamine-hydrolysing)
VASFDERSHDESELAARSAAVAGSRLTIVPVEIDHDAVQTFLSVVHHFDGQVADASAVAAFSLCRAVRQHVPVALSGDGADEFFGGYTTYYASRLAHAAQRVVPSAVAAFIGRSFAAWAGGDERRLPPVQILARFFLGLAGREPHTEWRRHVPGFLLPMLYGPRLRSEMQGSPLVGYEAAMRAGATHMDACLLADQGFYLPADMLMKVDAMSMAHGLEIRVPFLTREIIDIAGRIHAGTLCPPAGQPKAPLRRALEILGFPAAITRATKKGFNVPVDRLLRGSLAPLAARLLDRDADNLAPWLSPTGVRRLWHQHRDRQRSWGYALWTILSFAAWRESLTDV